MMNTTTIATRPDVVRASRTKRRMAAWLLLGWAAFWFVSVLQSCAEGPIGNAQAADRVAATPHAVVESAAIAHASGETSCAIFLNTQPAPLGVSITSLPAPDMGGKWITAPSLPPARQPARHAAHHGDDAPPPSVPAYLRSLRLLI